MSEYEWTLAAICFCVFVVSMAYSGVKEAQIKAARSKSKNE